MRTEKKERLKIGYKNFTLSFVNNVDKDGSCGECDYDKGKIKIKKGLCPNDKSNTVLHEILHAIFHVQGLNLGYKKDERIVLSMTNGLILFMQENPKFFLKIFREAMKEE